MAYIYLLNLHDKIDKKLQGFESSDISSEKDAKKISYRKGQVDALRNFKEFLSSHLDGKLPRRLRKKRKGN